jgi:hypothetical protein
MMHDDSINDHLVFKSTIGIGKLMTKHQQPWGVSLFRQNCVISKYKMIIYMCVHCISMHITHRVYIYICKYNYIYILCYPMLASPYWIVPFLIPSSFLRPQHHSFKAASSWISIIYAAPSINRPIGKKHLHTACYSVQMNQIISH